MINYYVWIHSDNHNCCYKQKKCKYCLNLMKNFDEFSIISQILDIYFDKNIN